MPTGGIGARERMAWCALTMGNQHIMNDAASGPVDAAHRRPPGLDDTTVLAVGELSRALETVHRVRGHLYSAHQLVGGADNLLDRVVELFRAAGHQQLADRVERELLGRNVLPGRWTYQIVEEFDDGYYATFQDVEREARERLAGGRRHLHEAEMKRDRRTPGLIGHELSPDQIEAPSACCDEEHSRPDTTCPLQMTYPRGPQPPC
jgi:hypothetical protein